MDSNTGEVEKTMHQNYPFSTTPMSVVKKNTDQSKTRPMLEAGKLKPVIKTQRSGDKKVKDSSTIKLAGNQTLFGATYLRQSQAFETNSARKGHLEFAHSNLSSLQSPKQKNQFTKGNGKDDHNRDNEQ